MSNDTSMDAKQCPACETGVTDPNPEKDMWYCESGECEVVLFGPRGLDTQEHGENDE